jgi:hypothetical protein
MYTYKHAVNLYVFVAKTKDANNIAQAVTSIGQNSMITISDGVCFDSKVLISN